MRRCAWARLLAVLLVICMVAPSASAATFGRSAVGTSGWSSWFQGIWVRIRGGLWDPEPTEPEEDTTLTLVEDETTVENGEMLRASTYALTTGGGATTYADDPTTLKYFPVTMYNYDKTTINNATHQVEVDKGLGNTWNGIYFNDGNPEAESYTYTTPAGEHRNLTWAQVQAGTYYSDEACTKRVTVNVVKEPDTEQYTQAEVTCNTLIGNDKSKWTACSGYYYTPDNGANYYPLYAKRSSGWW